MDIEETVKKVSIFRGLNDEDVRKVLDVTREIKFYDGDVIMQEGDEGDTLYLIVEGEVGVSKSLTMKFGDDDYRKTEKVLTRFRPEDHAVFGEMAMIGQDARSATIIARSDGVLLEIKREDFIHLIEDRPELGNKILMNMAGLLISRLRQASQDVMRLTTALSIALSK